MSGPTTPPPAQQTLLASGQPARFRLGPAGVPTLFNGNYSYRISVPQGATRLTIRLNSDTQAVDTDLYARYGADTGLADGSVVADFESVTTFANETIVIDSSSSTPLRPGDYYISIVLYTTGAQAVGSVTAIIERSTVAPPVSGAQTLRSGVPMQIQLPAVSSGTLFTGDNAFRIDVPANSAQLEIVLRTEPSSADVDLFARFAVEPAVVNGRIAADHASTSDAGNEQLTIQRLTVPALRTGTYFIALALYSTGVSPRSTLTATIIPETDKRETSIEKRTPFETVTGRLNPKVRPAVFVEPAQLIGGAPSGPGKQAPTAELRSKQDVLKKVRQQVAQ
jgi:hypothetical protein